ncbi:MAG: response regulator [Geobacteraceae bacterium]|nr:response regulator [Geobacteraceae bacterium]
MRIRKLLQIAIAVAIMAVFGLVAANLNIASKLTRITVALESAQTTAHDISELLVLTHDFALHGEERAAQQWLLRHSMIIASLNSESGGIVSPPPEAVVQAKVLPGLFQELVKVTYNQSDMQSQQKTLLINQLLANTQAIADSIHRWGAETAAIHKKIERTSHILNSVVPVLTLIIVFGLTLIVFQRVLKPLSTLYHAVQAVAKGDLSVRCATTTKDEFGELSRTFDAMAIDLVSELQQEVVERKRAEEALIESEYFFRESQKSAQIGSYKADFVAGIWVSSEVMDTIFGIDARYNRTIQGWLDIVHHEDRAMMMQYLNDEVIGGSKPFHKEYRIQRINDGETRWVLGLGEVKHDESGKVVSLLGTVQDITDRKVIENEHEVLETKMLQAQKLESLGVLAGGIAHDFNNILTSIIGNADLALMRINKESPVIHNLQQIEKSAARAADLAKQMLAYSGKGKFIVEDIDVNKLLTEMLHMLEVSISKKAVLRLHLAPALPTVEADATQLRQIVMNLVINASEAIDDKSGVISITTGCLDCDRSYLKDVWLDENITEGLYVYLEISDTGCGMDSHTVSKLFDPFFTTKFTGRGLGMAAVLGIVRGHNGAIKVYSEPGSGSSFKILLPASNRPAELFNDFAANDSWKGSGTVLLVDDEETVRGISGEMLKELGFVVLTANDGQDALEKYSANPGIDLIILDLTMPHMDGEHCFRRLRQLNPDIKVIMSSGFSEEEVIQKFAGKGFSGFIQKPYKLSALRDVLQRATLN